MRIKKLATMLFTLCLIIAMMPLASYATDADRWGDSLYVLGIQVTNANCNDVLGDGKVKYHRDTKTLTLTGATLDLSNYRNTSEDNNYACGINAWGKLNIVLDGDSTIVVSKATPNYNLKEYVYGIMAEDELTISGTGKLSIIIDKPGDKVLKYYGIDSSRKLIVDGSKLSVDMSGIEGQKSNGISATYQGFDLKNSAQVTVNGGAGTGTYDRSFGKSMVEGDSQLVTSSAGSAFNYYILSNDMKDNAWVSSDGLENWTKWYEENPLQDYHYVKFTGSSGGGSRAGGRLLINGREITNQTGIIDPQYVPYTGGSIEYDGKDTLTLTDAILDLNDFYMKKGNIVAGIYATGDLDIVLSGSSKILLTGTGYNKDSIEPKEYISGIECLGTLTITGGAADSLSIELGKNEANGDLRTCGIDADEGLVVEKTALNVEVGPNGRCSGMNLWCPITAKDGAGITVKAAGSSNKGVTGVNDIGKTVVDADSSLEMISEKAAAFDCWSPGPDLKAAGAFVNTSPSAEGAYEWDKSTRFPEYRYVRIPYTEQDIVPVPEFTISYNLNGGVLEGKTGVVTQKAASGAVITLPLPARNGYVFDYWEGSRYYAGDKYTVNGDHTFTAVWKTAATGNEDKNADGSGDADSSSGKKSVKTGDEGTIYTWITLMAVSLLGLACMAIGKKHFNKER